MRNIFENSHIPEKHKIGETFHQNTYLVDGELKEWNGETTSVYSPVYQKDTNGELQPTLLGTIPNQTQEDALEALNSANQAYDKGRGEWPTMRVEERINCVENFAKMMQEARDEVVN